MANQVTPAPFQPGDFLQDGAAINSAVALGLRTSQDGVVAGGSSSATATPLTAVYNRVTSTVAGGGVVLPRAFAGAECVIVNGGSVTTELYGSGTDTIDGDASASLGSAVRGASFYAVVSGGWISNAFGNAA